MKHKRLIMENYTSKLAIWLTGFNQEERLKEHIRMLDWVLSDGNIRTIEEIEKSPITQKCY